MGICADCVTGGRNWKSFLICAPIPVRHVEKGNVFHHLEREKLWKERADVKYFSTLDLSAGFWQLPLEK